MKEQFTTEEEQSIVDSATQEGTRILEEERLKQICNYNQIGGFVEEVVQEWQELLPSDEDAEILRELSEARKSWLENCLEEYQRYLMEALRDEEGGSILEESGYMMTLKEGELPELELLEVLNGLKLSDTPPL